MLDKLIFTSYALIFFLVPLFWTSLNFELFEYNKMMLTYGLTVIIVGIWLLKIIHRKSLILNRTPLDIPLLLFLGANILSTIFSIDTHTSIWGYYSRSNGGLLSLTSYLLLYWAFISNITKEQAFKLLKIGLASGFIISLWGIFEHFGVSLSCVILRDEFNASCWIQDVQSRVFATLGQPNWMAAYLAMLIFPAMYFLITSKTKKELFTFHFLLFTLYMAFTFTYSRGGFLGFLTGMGLFVTGILLFERKREYSLKTINIFFVFSHYVRKITNQKPLLILLMAFLLINLLFGSALTRFNLSQLLPQSTSDVGFDSFDVGKPTASTQLESGGTESGQIRLIVWRGALDIFKAYPLFGSGVETFAYSYYQFRPLAHNLVSEWDFLYNKAHNEFLNYLATTGIIGFGTYSIIIITFIIIILRKPNLLTISLLAAYVSYLVQNFFGFSVVIIAIFFYLFPAIAFVASDSTSTFHFPSSKFHLLSSIIHLQNLIYRRPIYIKAIQIFIVLSIFYLLSSIFKLWYADTLFAKGERQNELGNSGAAYNFLSDAVSLNKKEPFYRSELGYAAAASALALKDIDATLSAQLKDESIAITNEVLVSNPKNVSFWRTAIRTYFELSGIDEKYTQKTIETLEKTISLAPTDPKLLYNKAVILGEVGQEDKAVNALKKAIELKPDYRDAFFALALFQFDAKETELAVESMNKVLQIAPEDPEAFEKLNEWGKEGIATESGKPQ